MRFRFTRRFGWVASTIVLCLATQAHGAIVSNVAGTAHNLSSSGTGTVISSGAGETTEICVFCHTPHGANLAPMTPLWNRELGLQSGSYNLYDSDSLDAMLGQPSGGSKLCLSCHDGTIAIGQVTNAPGSGLGDPISMNIDATTDCVPGNPSTVGCIPSGPQGADSGFTRRLGTDLSNDHPISFTYDATLVNDDGELYGPKNSGTTYVNNHIDVRSLGNKPRIPLYNDEVGNSRMHCTTCHDPHIRDQDASLNAKFLRLNRFQGGNGATGLTPPQGDTSFDVDNDIICVGCHTKEGWTNSAHANTSVADEIYDPDAAALREFPTGIKVWQAACLNCHDTHSVQNSRRLLREGVDGIEISGTGKGDYKQGGGTSRAALEETCYQCHTTSGNSILTDVTEVPNIESDFTGTNKRMPITSAEQPAGVEVHSIGTSDDGAATQLGKDSIESQTLLGFGAIDNRHVECTDCHNPHRVIRNDLFNDDPASPDSAGTHRHTEVTGYTHTNLISGVLKGAWGVEPTYSSNSFHAMPSGFVVKRGNPPVGGETAVTSTYVTREYQICLKCHSNYGYNDNNIYPTGNRPELIDYPNGTPSGTNGLLQFTNQAKEFHAPDTHRGQPDLGTEAGAELNTNNRRSWHPVMNSTGRSGMSDTALRLPWSNARGTQTMYCSDCHGSSTGGSTVIPTGSNPWGPHGSSNNFILKGVWDNETGSSGRNVNPTANALCFKCHVTNRYAGESSTSTSGFCCGSGDGNLHNFHVKRIENIECTWCHIAVPHGWKNKALLVNLNDIGPEAGCAGPGNACNNVGYNFTAPPYYLQAYLRIESWADSGSWDEGNCNGGSKDTMKSNCGNPN